HRNRSAGDGPAASHRFHSIATRARSRRAAMVAFVGISVAACGGAGNPSLSSLTGPSKVRALRILPTATRACPGDAIQVTYEAALADGSRVPFGQAQSSALIRSGVAAEPKPDGSWTASADPLVSTVTGFHLTAKLASDSSIRADTVVVPKYDCRRPLVIGPGVSTQADTKHAYVRLGTFASPFYDSIVVATLEQAGQPPAVYVLVPGDFHPGGLRVSAP